MQKTALFKKVYGCMLGGAIGDALGGPVEHMTPEAIRETYGGNLDRYVPYSRPPAHHAQFAEGDGIGAYTDDTRLKHLHCQAIFRAGGKPRPGDLAMVLAEAYHHAPDSMHEGFVEEYYMQALWGEDKVAFGGEPTNGSLMANSPLGLITACRPDEAYQLGFDMAFLTAGYARNSSAMLVAAVAEAMRPNTTVDGIIDAARTAHQRFSRRREGDHWHSTEWRYDPNIQFLDKALEIARRERDVFAIREPLTAVLEWGHLFSEAIHTLVVALAMFVAAEGDVKQSIMGAIMYGRDKDSYASVAGALAGAFNGVDGIPVEWIQPVIAGNPAVDMHDYSVKLTGLIVKDYEQSRTNIGDLGALL
ncbi:MAG: ADP-ribosylglycohydrolase family protein [Anaerolineaceae bacterium]|nr:ADP-ribosylglycohydrolase family protein [Anaerolineaceae bacterium]